MSVGGRPALLFATRRFSNWATGCCIGFVACVSGWKRKKPRRGWSPSTAKTVEA